MKYHLMFNPYEENIADEILHIYKCFAPKWYSGPLTASHTSVRNDESSYNVS